MNTVCITGRLAHDCEDKSTTDVNVARMSIAVTNNDKARSTSYIDITGFNVVATLMLNLKKGMNVGVEGHLTQVKFEKKDGTKVSRLELIADRITFLEKKEKTNSAELPDESKNTTKLEIDEEDLPF